MTLEDCTPEEAQKQLQSRSLYSSGNNLALTTALALAGRQWLDDEEPVRVEYDRAYLAAVKCRDYAEARAKRHPGRFAFFFQSDGVKECLEAFDEANADFDRREKAGEAIEFLEQLPPAVRAGIVATVLRMHRALKEAPFQATPYLREWAGEIEQEGDGHNGDAFTVKFPASKVIRADAPDALWAEMGLE